MNNIYVLMKKYLRSFILRVTKFFGCIIALKDRIFARFAELKDRIFNRETITKVFIIFIFGFASRIIINCIYDINVFIEFTNIISILYYLVFAMFTVLVHEFVSYFNFVIIPSILTDWVIGYLTYINNIFVNIWDFIVKYLKERFTDYCDSKDKNWKSKQSNKRVGLRRVKAQDNLREVSNRSKNVSVSEKNKKTIGVVSSNNTESNEDNNKKVSIKRGHLSSSSKYFKLDPTTRNSSQGIKFIIGSYDSPSLSNPSTQNNFSFSEKLDISKTKIVHTSNQPGDSKDNGWNYVPLCLNKPTSTIEGGRGSIAKPDDISTARTSMVETNNFKAELEIRKDQVISTLKHEMLNPYTEEITVPTKDTFGKLKIGFKYIDTKLDKLQTIYIKFHDKGKGKIYWTLWEKYKNEYTSYAEFKKSWDPNTKIWKQIYKDIRINTKDEVMKLIDLKRPFDRPLDSSRRYPIDNINNRYNSVNHSNVRKDVINRNNKVFSRSLNTPPSGYEKNSRR